MTTAGGNCRRCSPHAECFLVAVGGVAGPPPAHLTRMGRPGEADRLRKDGGRRRASEETTAPLDAAEAVRAKRRNERQRLREVSDVVLDGRDAGWIYDCSIDMPEPTMYYPLYEESTARVNSVVHNRENTYALVCAADGSIRVHDNEGLDKSSLLHMHNHDVGGSTHAAVSFDGTKILSAGHDGNLFVYSAGIPGVAAEFQEGKELKVPTQPHIDDLLDPEAYCIEDAKQKEE